MELNGRILLVSTATQPTIFGLYDFESDDVGFEWSRSNRGLAVQKEVTREWDTSRGWGVRFPGTATQQLEMTINSPVLAGDTDYTISVWTIGSGSEVVDNGTGDLDKRWTVTNLGANRRVSFSTDGGSFVVKVFGAGTIMIFR